MLPPGITKPGGNYISFVTSNLLRNRTSTYPRVVQHTGFLNALKEYIASRFNDLVAHRVAHQLTHAMQFQLAHDIGAMCFSRLYADPQG